MSTKYCGCVKACAGTTIENEPNCNYQGGCALGAAGLSDKAQRTLIGDLPQFIANSFTRGTSGSVGVVVKTDAIPDNLSCHESAPSSGSAYATIAARPGTNSTDTFYFY